VGAWKLRTEKRGAGEKAWTVVGNWLTGKRGSGDGSKALVLSSCGFGGPGEEDAEAKEERA